MHEDPISQIASVASSTHRRGHATTSAIVLAFGLSCNLIWCTLMGHTLGFLSSSQAIGSFINPRIYFQAGIFIMAATMVAIPRQLEHFDRYLRFIIPLLSAAATAMFALSFEQDMFDSTTCCLIGLTFTGVGYCWLVMRFYYLAARTRGFLYVVIATAGALIIKELFLFPLGACPDAVQVFVAIIAPIVMAVLFEVFRTSCAHLTPNDADAAAKVFGIPYTPADARPATERTLVLFYSLVFALLLAAIRGFSHLGMWGDTSPVFPGSFPWLLEITIIVICMMAFTWFALVRTAHSPLATRFQLAIFVIFAGLIVIVLQGILTDPPYTLSLIVQIEEFLAHVTFWSVIVVYIDRQPGTSLRTMGIPLMVYSGVSMLLVVLLSRTALIATIVVLFAIYVVMLFLMKGVGQKGAASVAASSDTASDNADAKGAELPKVLQQRCDELAKCHKLSPRETEVFKLVAEGRSRSFISEKLSLSDSTVKTHITRIYSKLGVFDRQGMMELLLGNSSEDDGDKTDA